MKLKLFLFFILAANFSFAQRSDVDGYAYLENTASHENIMVVFERLAPSTLYDTVYTATDGYYAKTLEQGMYKVNFSKAGFLSSTIEEVNLFSNATLPEVTLLEGMELSGELSGFLAKGTYNVINNIYINSGNSLRIEPGVTLLFRQDVVFEAIGILLAEGNVNDSIYFISDGQGQWNGIDIKNNGYDSCYLSYCVISGSKTSGIYSKNSRPQVKNVRITGNEANSGGAVYTDNSYMLLENANISNNSANYAGGVYLSGGFSTIRGTEITQNTAIYGGGLVCSGDNNISSCIISNNSAQQAGGIYAYSGATTSLRNSTLFNNSATKGGGILCENANIYVSNCIFTDNNNYGIQVDYGVHEIIYSDFYNNSPANFFNCDEWIGVNVTINNNNDSVDSWYNLQLDPLFADTLTRDFRLLDSSPCIDAGINDSVLSEMDFGGNVRIWDGNADGDTIVDMGAFEKEAPLITNLPGTPPTDFEEKVMIYPNPTSGRIIINPGISSKIIHINLYDSDGRLIKTAYEARLIDIEEYPNGIYFLKIVGKDFTQVNKILKSGNIQ